MTTFALAGLLSTSLALLASGPQQADRIPVAIRLVGDDGLTQRLLSGIEDDLRVNPKLRLANADDRNTIAIESDSNVGWDELSGRTVVIYTVYVYRGENRGAPKTGICYESDIPKCAKAITRLARIRAEWP